MKSTPILITIAFTIFSSLAFGQNTTEGSFPKYHLFKPVPRDQMREFSIDRPDVTESPITVDAGHFQFEGDFYKWEKDQRSNGNRTINIFNGLYKLGLSNRWDIQFGIELYNIYKDPSGETLEKGYGNTTIRLKYNFWGNDGESITALGVIPYITFPTSQPDTEIAYGVGFPFSVGLSEALGAGAQFQFDFVPNESGGMNFEYLQTIVIGGTLIGNFDFYAEVAAIFRESPNFFTANGGIIYNISPSVKIDVATNIGLTRETYTNIFTGLSFRL